MAKKKQKKQAVTGTDKPGKAKPKKKTSRGK